jgi:APA family basic amino acid/polyamine antiporter
VRAGGIVQVATTLGKLVPLGILAVVLLAVGSPANLEPFAPRGAGAIFPAITLIAWLFLGAESATVPVEEVRGAGRTVRSAAWAGYLLASGMYVGIALALALGLPSPEIAGSASPLAVAARRVMGPAGEALVTVGALVSIGGILNGWLLVTGRLPFAAARQGFAPQVFGRLLARTGTPALALVFSSAISSVLVLLYFDRTLLQAYNFVALASTATALVAIGITCASLIVLARREPDRFEPGQLGRATPVGIAGLAIVTLMIAGSGTTVLLCTAAAVALPLPYALWLRRRRG